MRPQSWKKLCHSFAGIQGSRLAAQGTKGLSGCARRGQFIFGKERVYDIPGIFN